MIIAVDKNQCQRGSHIKSNDYNHRKLVSMGHELLQFPLPYGDYAEVTKDFQDTVNRRRARLKKADLVGDIKIAVDRKNSVSEICGNVCSSKKNHERFRDECILAQKCGCKFYVLIEDYSIRNLDELEKWENPRAKKYFVLKEKVKNGTKLKKPLPKQPPASGKKLASALRTIEEKYDVTFVFCKPTDAAEMIVRLLEGDKENDKSRSTQT